MKKQVISLSLFFGIMSAIGQNKLNNSISLNSHELIGRWTCYDYTLELVPEENKKPTFVYFFKDNKTFHKGKITEGAIIFNITGEYSISNDTIKIFYYDYLNQTTNSRTLQKEFLKVFYRDKERMDADIIEPKNQLPITLKRPK